MKVDLVAHTPNAEALCAAAMKLCQAPDDKSFIDMYRSIVDSNIKEFISLSIELGHVSVLEHASFTFSAEGISRVLTHQLVRHRLASYTQQSQRHVKLNEPTYVLPSFDYVSDEFADKESIEIEFRDFMQKAWNLYRDMLSLGAKPEDARFVLPNACTTKIVVTMNARELRHFFKLRCSKHAQWEIRELANKMLELCYDKTPIIFEDLHKKFIRMEVNNENK